jgi:hypothetical protein
MAIHSDEQLSDYLIINNYTENIYINDSKVTKDYTKDEDSFKNYHNLVIKTEIFNNLENSKFQVVFPDNFRAIYKKYIHSDVFNNEENIGFEYTSKTRKKDWIYSYKEIKNTLFSNTGCNRDYENTDYSQVTVPFPRNTIVVRKHIIVPKSFIDEIAINLSESEFIQGLSKYSESKKNTQSDKSLLYGIIWALAKNNDLEVGAIIDLIRTNAYSPTAAHFIHEYRIDEPSLYYSGQFKGLYFEPANIIISKDIHTALDHPFSTRDLLAQRRKALVNNFKGFHFSIDIVDNSGEYDTRFLPFGKDTDSKGEESVKVIEIYPVKDSLRKDGVYVHTVKNVGGRVKSEDSYYTMVEAQAIFNLYTNMEAAKTHGNISASLDIELEKLKREGRRKDEEITLLKKNYSELEHQLDKEKILREEEFNKRKLEREDKYEDKSHKRKDNSEKRKDKYEDKSTKRKDDYEDRSHKRKDNSEIVKYLPSLLVGVMGIAIALFKFW